MPIIADYQCHGWTFRYTHDLKELVTDLKQAGLVVPPEVDDAAVLTSFAWESRYPGLSDIDLASKIGVDRSTIFKSKRKFREWE